ncbi:hypothetical protein DPMN_093519 [Dreissena polymorpha]|uniref:Uncharacterized protein n=1 Tax=Dreissena polymorpha TaxID=45954 RepID=A0A9D4R1Z3_DREPO|nr:hypothetical protein DPMN_093519 [Dreissena polymorpha]
MLEYFRPTFFLHIRILGKVVKAPGNGAGCRVVALEHERVYLVSDLLVRQADTVGIL